MLPRGGNRPCIFSLENVFVDLFVRRKMTLDGAELSFHREIWPGVTRSRFAAEPHDSTLAVAVGVGFVVHTETHSDR